MAKKFDLTQPYQTREGCEAGGFSEGPDGLLYGWIKLDHRHCIPARRNPDGTSFFKVYLEDLINIPETRTDTFWLNIYPSGVAIHKSRRDAVRWGDETRLACVEHDITYTIGEGLDDV